MSKSRYSKKFGTPNPNLLSQKKEQTMSNNGIPLIRNQQEKVAMLVQLRLQLSSNILGHIAAVDFQHAIHKAVAARDIAPDPENANLQINIAPNPVAQMAVSYADALLIGLGMMAPPAQEGIQQ